MPETRTACKRCGRWFVVRTKGGGRPRWYCDLTCESLARAAKYQAKPKTYRPARAYEDMKRKGEL